MKILLVSTIPTHPQDQGNRVRSHAILSNLKKMGHEVHMVYEDRGRLLRFRERSDKKSMKEAWDGFYTVPMGSYWIRNFIDVNLGKFGIFLRKHIPKMYSPLKNTEKKFRKEKPPGIDDLYNPGMSKFLRKLSKKEKFDAVIVNYVHQSRALECFGDNVLKVIDTHDAITNNASYNAREIYNDFNGATYQDKIIYSNENESRALKRADVIMAIQDEERKFFSDISDRNVVTVGHIINKVLDPIKRNDERKNIFFISTVFYACEYAVNFFSKEVLPRLREKYPDAKFVIAGGIGDYADGEGIVKLGRVDNIEDAYKLADVVVCPLFQGTGLKIKNVEALAHCKPLVTTTVGSKGLEAADGKALFIADTADEFVKSINKIFSDRKLYERMSRNARDFIEEYNMKNIENLRKVFK